MRSPGSWLADGTVTVAHGRVVEVESATRTTASILTMDHGRGVIMPGLVNAHTHLSLSALSGKIEIGEGFLTWIRKLVEVRRNLPPDAVTAAMEAAVNRLQEAGVALVGEFGPHIPVAPALAAAGIAGTIWLEFLGNEQDLPPLPPSVGEVDFAYAGHAPHTSSPSLLRHIKEIDRRLGRRFSLHLAESSEEMEFLATGNGEWAGFLQEMGRDFSAWGCWGRRPVELAAQLGLLDEDTISVHCLFVRPEEVQLLARSGSHLCLCPRSNWSLHGRLPDIPAFLEAGLAPALGTDSLASTESLSMFDEMRFLAGRYPMLSPDTILAMATVNGARALGRLDLGTISPGQTARLVYVDLEAATATQAAERLVNGSAGEVSWVEGLPRRIPRRP
jgi:cytosine/adenosine deaminase-related metal-dependent hydrolase